MYQRSFRKWVTIYVGKAMFSLATIVIILWVGFWSFTNIKDKVHGRNSAFGGCVFGAQATFTGRIVFMCTCRLQSLRV
jgi:hypothetical protein